jgi:hypothetical protein
VSVQALAWVLDSSAAVGSERLVLIAIANHAGKEPLDDAWEGWPGIETIAAEAKIGSIRTVQRTIASLVGKGLLEVVHQGAPDFRIRGDRRPNLYRVPMHGVTPVVTPSEIVDRDHGVTPGVTPSETADPDHGVTNGAPRGDKNSHGVTPCMSPEPSLEPKTKPKIVRAPADAGAGLVPWKPPHAVVDGGQLETAGELCRLLGERLSARGHKVNPASKAWLEPMEAMLRIDRRPPEEIRWVIDWLDAGADSVSHFWRTNVLSPATLRQRWPRMREQLHALRNRPSSSPALADVTAQDLAQRFARLAQ